MWLLPQAKPFLLALDQFGLAGWECGQFHIKAYLVCSKKKVTLGTVVVVPVQLVND